MYSNLIERHGSLGNAFTIILDNQEEYIRGDLPDFDLPNNKCIRIPNKLRQQISDDFIGAIPHTIRLALYNLSETVL